MLHHSMQEYAAEIDALQNPTLADMLLDLKRTHYGMVNAQQQHREIKEAALSLQMCPKCLNPLTLKRWSEARGEHFGIPAQETCSKYICEFCHWEEEE